MDGLKKNFRKVYRISGPTHTRTRRPICKLRRRPSYVSLLHQFTDSPIQSCLFCLIKKKSCLFWVWVEPPSQLLASPAGGARRTSQRRPPGAGSAQQRTDRPGSRDVRRARAYGRRERVSSITEATPTPAAGGLCQGRAPAASARTAPATPSSSRAARRPPLLFLLPARALDSIHRSGDSSALYPLRPLTPSAL
jgi:hypothetical protein